jgi:hypothetical protein
LATAIAPAFTSKSTIGALTVGLQSFKATVDPEVIVPFTSMLHLTRMGRPSSGLASFSAILLSDSRAEAKAEFVRTSTQALVY